MNKGLIKYELLNYLKSGKEIAPILLFICWIFFAYSISPINMMRNFGLTSLAIFLVMIMVSLSHTGVSNQMIEQSFFVKIENKYWLYTAKIFVVFFFSLILTFIGIICPIIINAFSNFSLFDRPATVYDWFIGAILLLTSALSGGLIGLFSSQRIFKKHRSAVLLFTLIGLCSILKGIVIEDFWPFKFFAWILPPVYDLCNIYTNNAIIQLRDVGLHYLWIIFYSVILIILYIKIMLCKGFE